MRTCARSPPSRRSRGSAWTTTSARSWTAQAKQDYVDFYAHLHRVVDEKIGRLLSALGSAEDPDSLRSRTVVIRTSDHGEMGLSHGGLRQKIFNAYEETIRVPLVISNPRLFPQPRESDALVSLLDIVPTCLGLAGAGDAAGEPRRRRPLAAAARRAAPRCATRSCSPTTTTRPAPPCRTAPGQPNRIRCVRDERLKYAVYLDPAGRAQPEFELYDLDEDPLEMRNLARRPQRTRARAPPRGAARAHGREPRPRCARKARRSRRGSRPSRARTPRRGR